MATNVKKEFQDMLHQLTGFGVSEYARDQIACSTIYNIYTYEDDFDYVYRRIAYFTSCWENVYITGVSIGNTIVVCVDVVKS